VGRIFAIGVLFVFGRNKGILNFRGALLTESDGLGNTVRYFYNNRGLLAATVDVESGTGVGYTYDVFGSKFPDLKPKKSRPSP
jgi:YD repeat-containing protein